VALKCFGEAFHIGRQFQPRPGIAATHSFPATMALRQVVWGRPRVD
jgi:hypothetical protein